MHNFRSPASPGPSISSDLPPIFDIGLPPRQDHRSSFASYSTSQSRRPSPSTASTAHSAVHSENYPASPVDTRHIYAQMASPHGPSQDWEAHVVKITNPEDGSAAYQCTWTTPEKACHYWSKKQLVKRHVETTHLKFKCATFFLAHSFGLLIAVYNVDHLFATSAPRLSRRCVPSF